VFAQGALVLLTTTVLVPAAIAGIHGRAETPSNPSARAPRVVVRTELVPASRDGFDWLDAAAGFGLATASGAVGLLLVAGHRNAGGKQTTQRTLDQEGGRR
jgi:hypothetical protein